MDISTLQYFISIAETKSFSQAAEKNLISQSSLSKAVIRLENELGVKLFDRNHHPVELTYAGQRFYEDLIKIRPLYQSALKNVEHFRERHSVRCYFVPNLLAVRNASVTFAERNPDIELEMVSGSDYETEITDLENGDFDIGIMHQPLEAPCGYRQTILYDDSLYVVIPNDDPLASLEYIPAKELNERTFVESGFHVTVVEAISKELDFHPKEIIAIKAPAGSREECLVRISHGKKTGIFCGRDISMFNLESVGLVKRKLDEIQHLPIVMIERKEHTQTEWHQRFCKFIKEEQVNFTTPLS